MNLKNYFNIDENSRTVGSNARGISLLRVPLFQEFLLFEKNGLKDKRRNSRQ